MNEHTPTPLQVEAPGKYTEGWQIRDAYGQVVARNMDEVRAHTVVTACNAHDELVEALEGLVSIAEMYHKGEAEGHLDACENPDNCGHCLAMRKVESALARASAGVKS